MTAQVHDLVNYKNKEFVLVGINGKGLFDPEEHNLHPVGSCSACWRGFLCGYIIKDNKILLDKLWLCLDEEAHVFLGVQPSTDKKECGLIFDAVYPNLEHQVPFTGGILLADDFIEELYVHMGFHPAWKFKEVHELIFDDGQLQNEYDRSQEIAQFRDDVKNRPLKPEAPNKVEIEQWIKRCFSLDYKW